MVSESSLGKYTVQSILSLHGNAESRKGAWILPSSKLEQLEPWMKEVYKIQTFSSSDSGSSTSAILAHCDPT